MNKLKIALKISNLDNVATIFANNVTDGDIVELRDRVGTSEEVRVFGAVPYGHKIATRDIALGESIMKYSEEIGVATHFIRKGEYVHVHNLDSMRGRGDLPERSERNHGV